MNQNKRYLTLICILALAAVFIAQRSTAYEGEAIALRGGTVVTVTGATIPKGTVVIRNGLIEAVGAEVTAPADARVIDTTGLMIYPGLIDSYTNLGLGSAQPAALAGRGGGAPATPNIPGLTIVTASTAAAPTPSGQSPELMAADQLRITAEAFDQQRSAGITTVLTAPREGIYQGQSVLLNLGGEDKDKLIIRNPASLNVGFASGRGFGGGYPSSGMGVFAFLRQSLLDAQWYRAAWARYHQQKRGLQRPENDKSLAALQPVINGELPVLFAANTVREMQRAVGLGEEFKLKFLIAGGQQGAQISDWLKQKDVTVLLSLNFPQRPNNIEDPESESLRTLRERADAPKAAAALHKAGVRFALQSGYLTRPADFLANAIKAVEAGLPKDSALKALTITPAEIFGVSEQLGSIEKGKIANLIVTSGDLFERRAQMKYVFVDGKQYEVKAPTPPAAGPGGRPGGPGRPGVSAPAISAAGAWSITTQSPQGPVQATLNFQQEGNALSGQITTPFGAAPISGQVNGNEVSFSFSLDVQGEKLNVTGKGTIEGNTIKGKMYVMDQEHEFSGARMPR